MTTSFQPRRSQRLSQSSVVRFPSESKSPTPGKLHRISTPGRFAETRTHSYSYSQPLSSIHSDDTEEDDEDMMASATAFPKVILLQDKSPSSPALKSVRESLSHWGNATTEILGKKKTHITFLLNAVAVLCLLAFGYYSIPWSALSTSLAFTDVRFMLMVAPDFLLGLFGGGASQDIHLSPGASVNIDLIVNKIISNEKFGQFVREMHKSSKAASELKMTEDMDRVIQSISSDHSDEIRSSVKHLQERMISNKASLEEQFSDVWKRFEELKAFKEEESSSHKNKLKAFEDKLKELNDKVGAVKDYLVRSESIVHRCEAQIREMSSATNDFIRDYVNELIYDNSSKLSLHLRDTFVSQKDMNLIVSDMKTTLQSESSSPSGSIGELVERALIKYDADKTGMFDFALESAGGTILSTRCTETYDVAWAVHSIFGIPFWWERNNARTILQPSSNPGECWAFKGSQGSVVVELSRPVTVEAFSLEHISKMMAPERKILSAPRRFTVLGLRCLEDERPVVFGNFTYDDNGNPVQTFRVGSSTPVKLVELKVLSNYGHRVYTCLYRFRVHGQQPNN